MTVQNFGLKPIVTKPNLVQAMKTNNSCEIKFVNQIDKRTGLRVKVSDGKITTEVKLDGVSYEPCKTVDYVFKEQDKNPLHLVVATKNSKDRNKDMQINDIDLDSITMSLLNPQEDMPSPEVIEQEAYDLLSQKYSNKLGQKGDGDEEDDDDQGVEASDLLQMGYYHRAKEVMRSNLALIEEDDDMHEVLFKHFTTLKLYESNLAKFSNQIEEVIRDEE